jgi:DNA-binding GntR family transcriptional regulator
MRTIGIVIDDARISIRAETAGSRLGKLLRISPRTAVLVLRRTCIGVDGAAKEIASLSVCSESYEFVGSTRRAGETARAPFEGLFDIRAVEPA